MGSVLLAHVIRDHLLLGGFVAWLLSPLLGSLGALLFWGATVLIDFDHHVSFVMKTGMRNLFRIQRMLRYQRALFERAPEREFITLDPLHTLEALGFLTLVACLWPTRWLQAILLGFWLHFVTDLVHVARFGRFSVRAYSFLEYWIRRRNLSPRVVIGIDFDNTIVNYDGPLQREALQMGCQIPTTPWGKHQIRDAIRKLPDGEEKWRALQAALYGPRIGEAEVADGAISFFQSCRRHGIPVRIISHKTRRPPSGDARIDFRQSALDWMEANKFFAPDGLGITRTDVYFESTRQEKLRRIRILGCTHLIDDLEETFLETSFPPQVEKILYAPDGQGSQGCSDIRVFRTWKDIHDHFFGSNHA